MVIKRPNAQAGYQQIVSTDVLDNLTFGLLFLNGTEDFLYREEEMESVLVLINGQVTFNVDGKEYTTNLRRDLFTDNPSAIYLPKSTTVLIRASVDSELAVAKASCTDLSSVCFVHSEKVSSKYAGEWNWKRIVRDIIGNSVPAKNLIVGETINLPGCWSSWPPHKHDTDDFPKELKADELYHFRIRPKEGFAMQRIYDDQEDKSYVIKDGDTVVTKRGYHPVVAAPGVLVYYLWIVSNDKRLFLPSFDPTFESHKNLEFMAKEMH
ncbi:MAG: 5-deoxy-glucuronate isomerase [Pseudothermotoga sp.]